ncbi:MAG: hypothetical protein ABSB59_06080 [Streptosporangiaceae bacterium]|jgi:hypothetical protein
MSTRIKIEQLVLDGIELSRRERDALGPAIARELRQLGGDQASGRDEPRHRSAGRTVDEIAREVAAAVRQAAAAARPAAPPVAPPVTPPVTQRGRR